MEKAADTLAITAAMWPKHPLPSPLPNRTRDLTLLVCDKDFQALTMHLPGCLGRLTCTCECRWRNFWMSSPTGPLTYHKMIHPHFKVINSGILKKWLRLLTFNVGSPKGSRKISLGSSLGCVTNFPFHLFLLKPAVIWQRRPQFCHIIWRCYNLTHYKTIIEWINPSPIESETCRFYSVYYR